MTTSIAYEAITWAEHYKLVTGSGGRFNPTNQMSRAQFALVLYRYEGEPSVSGRHSFSDVTEGTIADKAVTWASQNSIVTGSGGKFNPSGNMTRAQMILMMHRYSILKGFDLSSNPNALAPFTDRGQLSPTAAEAMRWGVHKG